MAGLQSLASSRLGRQRLAFFAFAIGAASASVLLRGVVLQGGVLLLCGVRRARIPCRASLPVLYIFDCNRSFLKHLRGCQRSRDVPAVVSGLVYARTGVAHHTRSRADRKVSCWDRCGW